MTEPAPEQVRESVVARYSGLARSALDGQPAVDCGPDAFTDGGFGAAGYIGIDAEEALDVSLGCGNPVAIADLAAGDVVLDLGSGGGLDVLLSGRRVGPSGRVYGVDASEDMLALARRNAERAGATNVEFRHGHIENLPLPDGHVDVVISNCVVNLSTDKQRVLTEIFRVLRPGGRVGISDVVAEDRLSPGERAERGSYVGCIAGALSQGEYEKGLREAGFADISVHFTHRVADGMHSAIVQAVKGTD